MRIFGTILPFIGFREVEVDPQLRRFLELDADVETINTFQLEWLGISAVLPLKPRDERERED